MFFHALGAPAYLRPIMTATCPRFAPALASLTLALMLAGCAYWGERNHASVKGPAPTRPPQPAASGEATTPGTAPGLMSRPAESAEPQMAPLPFKVETYIPDDGAIFSPASTLVIAQDEVLLIDAQFSTLDAERLAARIRSTGKPLTRIFISDSAPEHYFGLDTLKQHFPDAQVLATPETVAAIRATRDLNMQVWAPRLGRHAPRNTHVPAALEDDQMVMARHKLKIIGRDSAQPDRTFVWIPTMRTVAGGPLVYAGEHVPMDAALTDRAQADWLQALARIEALQPGVVVPGHYTRQGSLDISAVRFTADYLRAFAEEASRTRNADQLIDAMKTRFPGLRGEGTLAVSARLAKGESD